MSKPLRSFLPFLLFRGIAIHTLLVAYLLVHLKLEWDIWSSPEANPFEKFSHLRDLTPIETARKAYLAKSTWLLLTVLLIAFRTPVQLALGIGSMVYGLELMTFFGPVWMGWGSFLLGVAVIGEWCLGKKRGRQ